ncbi:hypothetical protein JCM8097_006602 [Rhodosporidiobolus ruineniae]
MSSSSPSSVPPLPTELILHILHLAYPPNAEDDYTGRSSDVLQCCLVSKQWKELTEPVLWQSVTITSSSPEQIRRALRVFKEVEHVRFASFELYGQETPGEFLKLSDFAALPNLHSLGLAGPDQLEASTAVLPHLELLGMPGAFLDHACLASLNPNTTPALRVLVTDYVPSETDPRPLLDLLDIVELDMHSSYASDMIFQHPFRNVVLAVEVLDLIHHTNRECLAAGLPFPPRHLRLKFAISWPALDNIFLLPHRPESLFLPLYASSSYTAAEANDAASEAFLKRCKDEGVEVRWYRPAEEEWRGIGCREFREYLEERKGKVERS